MRACTMRERAFDAFSLAVFFRLGLGAGARAITIPKVQVADINWERQQVLDDPNRVFSVDREIAQAQKASQKAAFPEAERNDAFFGLFRGDALEDESDPEYRASGEANDLPCVDFQWVKFKSQELAREDEGGNWEREVHRVVLDCQGTLLSGGGFVFKKSVQGA